jgi:UDP-N-acetylmuramate--alanine ligase
MDADHLDIYGTSEAIRNLLLNLHLKLKTKQSFITKELPLEGVTCAVNEDARLLMLELEMVAMFLMYKRHGSNQDLHFGLPGRHNLMNALMAIAMAKLFGTNQ